ncbi:hypothetical protein GCM10020219_029830 [Nonomuraea dietziae]
MFLPLKLSLAKANPARVEKNITATAIDPATRKELSSAMAKGTVSKTRATLAKKLPPGSSGGGTSASAELCREATTTL